jgi:ubiquinone biosynthesis protein
MERATEDWQAALTPFLHGYQTTAERIAAVESVLDGKEGKFWRDQLGKWTVRMVPVEELVPEVYKQWRPLVRDAMLFVVARLSAARLAPKVVEQMELPPDTPAEARLLQFISKVPGLQKIGQVLARNRNLDPRFRRALSALENGISDVSAEQIRAMVFRELGNLVETYAVLVEPEIFSEASVSAVVRFTWRNNRTGRREPGVFKVMKPYIPSCYAEDMKILQRLASHLARKHRGEGVRLAGLAETLTEIRLLLEHEVDFRREQRTLRDALRRYRRVPGVRVPRVIEPLSTGLITALTHENGVKITEAFGRRAATRTRVAERLAEALIAVPALAREDQSIFHADPHAGNILYDKRRGDLVILDWALTERLSRAQRRNVLMLVLMLILRDEDGVCQAMERLRQHRAGEDPLAAGGIRRQIRRFLDAFPLLGVPGPMDAMRLLDEIALEGIQFPAALLMFRKASFTLEGVLEDIAGNQVRVDSVIAGYALKHWMASAATFFTMLSVTDWIALDWSALTFLSRFCTRALLRPWLWFGTLTQDSNVAQQTE